MWPMWKAAPEMHVPPPAVVPGYPVATHWGAARLQLRNLKHSRCAVEGTLHTEPTRGHHFLQPPSCSLQVPLPSHGDPCSLVLPLRRQLKGKASTLVSFPTCPMPAVRIQ